ncbi:MAG: bifunctional serine/threonine-protein kinase/formylglycine-generating enzyme family protein [Pseudomonadales bacterium]
MSDEAPRDLTLLRPQSRGRLNAQVSREEATDAATPRVLKSRFVLEERLGTGGMGTVYRARDLRKVEARDRSPHVAVKVLNADIRRHPEAFIALEREAVRSQQLAHPNIVSIYDFDKDGNVPFLTMELLQGRELGVLLQSYPHGLPDELAWPLVRGMCEGLSYAHAQGVVHADFKPGNVFFTETEQVKILDFGLARAVQIQHEGGEDTAFDPVHLGALTPAYASLEMIRGEPPEARDDLYALAVVIYMIFTGRHPYDRKAADEALENGMVPDRPRRLGFRQWRALRASLALERDQRPASVQHLQQALLGRTNWTTRIGAAAAVVMFGVATSFYVIEAAQIDDVRDEVRQVTLLDVQAARVSSLVEEPLLDPVWLQRLDAELQALAAVDADGAAVTVYRRQAGDVVAAGIASRPTVAEASRLFTNAAYLLPSPAMQRALATSLGKALSSLVPIADLPRGDPTVRSALADLTSVQNVLSETGHLLDVEVVSALTAQSAQVLDALVEDVRRLHAQGDSGELASTFIEAAQGWDFAAGAVEVLRQLQPRKVAAPRSAVTPARKPAPAASPGVSLQPLKDLLAASCLRLDIPGVATLLRGYQEQPAVFKQARSATSERLEACIGELESVDVELARGLHRDVQVLLDGLVSLNISAPDACAAPETGANGHVRCRDTASFGKAPELTILPGGDGAAALAVTRTEISTRDFAVFCAATGRCEIPASDFPVTGVAPALVKEFADWLSRETGHRYRLPTSAEWLRLVDARAPGARQCGSRFLGRGRPVPVSEGAEAGNGLLHVADNVRELAWDEGAAWVMGSGFRDKGEDCASDRRIPLADGVDDATGFRLIRELS